MKGISKIWNIRKDHYCFYFSLEFTLSSIESDRNESFESLGKSKSNLSTLNVIFSIQLLFLDFQINIVIRAHSAISH